jgi:hypothetical protein
MDKKERYLTLMDNFVSRKITATEFRKKFYELFYDEKEPGVSETDFNAVDVLFGWLEWYEKDTRKRCKDHILIDSRTLRKKVEETLQRLRNNDR